MLLILCYFFLKLVAVCVLVLKMSSSLNVGLVLEKLALSKLRSHINTSSRNTSLQSETAITKVISDLLTDIDSSNSSSLLLLLDIRAAVRGLRSIQLCCIVELA